MWPTAIPQTRLVLTPAQVHLALMKAPVSRREEVRTDTSVSVKGLLPVSDQS